MNRTKIVEAILNQNHTVPNQALMEALKYLSDMNLLGLAISLGVDTDAVLTEVKVS